MTENLVGEKAKINRSKVLEKVSQITKLVDRGFTIIPLKDRSKEPAVSGWSDEGYDNFNYERTIKFRWTKFPDNNVGVIAGEKSGVIILDADGDEGRESVKHREAELGTLPPTLTCKTGRGEHRYFKHPGPGIRVKNNNTGKLGKHLDIKGDGGYVVAPPSIHPSGAVYEWVDENAPIAALPDAWYEKITEEDAPLSTAHDALIPQGERNDTLFRLVVNELFNKTDMIYADVLNVALMWNRNRCSPPLDETEVRTLVASAARYRKPKNQADEKKTKDRRRCPLYWMMHNVPSFFSAPSTAQLTDAQCGWWLRLTSFAWMRGGILPADEKMLYQLARASSRKRFAAERHLVLSNFTETTLDGKPVLVDYRMMEDYQDALDAWLAKVVAGYETQKKALDKKLKEAAAKKAAEEAAEKKAA